MADKRKLATEIERTLKQVRRRMVYSAEGAFGDVADRPLGGGPGAGRSLRACPALPRPSRGIAAVLGVRRRRCTAAARLASRQGPRRLAYSCNRITPSGSHSSGRRATGTWAPRTPPSHPAPAPPAAAAPAVSTGPCASAGAAPHPAATRRRRGRPQPALFNLAFSPQLARLIPCRAPARRVRRCAAASATTPARLCCGAWHRLLSASRSSKRRGTRYVCALSPESPLAGSLRIHASVPARPALLRVPDRPPPALLTRRMPMHTRALLFLRARRSLTRRTRTKKKSTRRT